MSSCLVRGRFVVCGVRDRHHADVLDDGAVLVRDGRIVEAGAWPALSRHDVDEVIGGPGAVIVPGFVNAHHHVGLTPVQMGCADLPLELWLATFVQLRDVDPYLDTLYSAFEMIASGVTTVQHLAGWAAGSAEQMGDSAERMLDAYRDLGMRVSYSWGIADQNLLVYDDEAFLAGLPEDLRRRAAEHIAAGAVPLEDQLGIFERLRRRCENDERAAIQLAPNNLHWCSDRALGAILGEAERHQVPMHMHLLETPYQKAYARRRCGGSAVDHLRHLGLLGPAMTLGHGVWMTEADIELVADSGTHICHNPSSNLRLRSGMLPLNALEERGVRVALGIDEAGINDDRDMLQEMRLAKNLHREPGMDDRVPTAPQVLRMATENGACTTGFAGGIGRIEPGRAADLVVLDWSEIAGPYLALDRDVSVVDAIVHRARAGAVRTVLVAGEPIYRDRRFTRVDHEAALEELAGRMALPLTVEERGRRDLERSLMPHVRRFYDGWLDDEPRVPFQSPSSRR